MNTKLAAYLSYGRVKGAAAWDKALARLSVEEAAPYYSRLLRQVHGVRPPLNGITEANRNEVVQRIRALQRAPELNDAPYGSLTYRAALRDMLTGNMRRLEHGTSLPSAQSIEKHGPGHLLHTPSHVPEDAWDRRLDLRKTTRDDYDAGMALYEKERSGIYANDFGTDRTGSYARGSNGAVGGPPARLSFDYPASLTRGDLGQYEQRIPRNLFNRFARNKRVDTSWDWRADALQRKPITGFDPEAP